MYASVLAAAIPGRVLYSQTAQYLTARGAMAPSTVSGVSLYSPASGHNNPLSQVCALVTNLCLGLFLVAGVPSIPGGRRRHTIVGLLLPG